ncbi:tRNA (guanosine(37)-N1)-methyltransferase TrmD [Candidatus Gottesmanbacteria bacterium RIFCSPHIGHO2_02_FULL_39_11]|uniref:tRNA (guanine-N(1)-)-methyltransferase n=1 Tax=Candidatus Gottesmanbacteria bacterium RIFCSPHIGHO2_02_FULL_39_11 TaxID=1798382 RepID=A0A1F5ZTB6_9BACT|nr:MAG: tRNA (guanosine(37)-N1)-methyltransferase TrmD [Candidatus Gottesmanbacteria bacterium RIFCSPHIGHO2_02_FULL_39_11]
MVISLLTLFPQTLIPILNSSILLRAQKKNLVRFDLVNIRDYSEGKRRTVDRKPYGGGVGMILKVDVLVKAIEATIQRYPHIKKNKRKIILTEAGSALFTQKKAKMYSHLDHLILISGHYEGVDARIYHFIDASVSVGKYVVTGGELPILIIADSVTRLIPNVLNQKSVEMESYFDGKTKEFPQYTRPPSFRGFPVPPILLSGNHAQILKWKKEKLKSSNFF